MRKKCEKIWNITENAYLCSISTGKYADFLLVDKDVLSCPETEIHEAKSAATYFEGKKVLYLTDVHSIPQNRVNVIVTLFDDWYRLFNVTDGKLYLAPEKRVQIW